MNDYLSSILQCSIFRVKLAVNRETEQAIAVKIIDVEKAADCYDNVRKEVSGVYRNRDNGCERSQRKPLQ